MTGSSTANMRTRKYLRYTTGLGIRTIFNALFTLGIAGTRQIIGLGDQGEGLFFGYNGARFGILRRSNGVDNWTEQSAWNMDRLDGSGGSGVMLDPTKGNLYRITYQGDYGVITFFVAHPSSGVWIPVHQQATGNVSTAPAIFTLHLPLMAAVDNGSTTANPVLRTSTAIAGVEGVATKAIATRQAFSNSKRIGSSSEVNLFTIQNKDLFNSVTNRNSIRVFMLSIAVDGEAKNIEFSLRRNAVLTGNTTFTNIHTENSSVAYNTEGTYTQGTGSVKFSSHLSNTDSNVIDLSSLDIPLPVGETITVTARTSGSTSTCSASLNWMEFY
ncbi:hypothetical protein BEP19_09555 [Ammoniphilus oxalaticus]|uniref:Uncharacterized protein n=2 Tax=Ammoniphilus oxalaticus TaxID=66863 RepID=A0A419SL55_9BACL|nr:hypothetical protein BEP19_09555 [Ammoniphilus oxalaticus]